MADLDDEAIIVSLPDDGDGTITKVDGDKTVVADDPINDLKSQFDALKNQTSKLETTNQTLVERVSSTEQQLAAKDREIAEVRGQVTDSQLDTVLSGIQAAEAEASAAEAAYKDAYDAGDGAAQARALRKISSAETKIQRLKEAKEDLEDAKKTAPTKVTRTEPTQPVRQQTVDPVEQIITTGKIPPKSANWLRAHPEAITDADKNRRMLAAHNLALIDDIPVESDEYFARIEAAVNKTPAKVVTTPAKPTDGTGKRPMSAAASGANTGGGMNGGVVQVPLTEGELKASEDGTHVWNWDDPKGKFKKGDPIGRQEFARRKMIMKKEGRYDRTYTE
jgi:hypothetical protein